jgi:hypothetical protein
MKKKPQSWQFPNPPKAEEIRKAREVVIKVTGREIKSLKEMEAVIKGAMYEWGEGWHDHEIYFGILIGLQIAKMRRDLADDYRDWDYQDKLEAEREEDES